MPDTALPGRHPMFLLLMLALGGRTTTTRGGHAAIMGSRNWVGQRDDAMHSLLYGSRTNHLLHTTFTRPMLENSAMLLSCR